MNANIEGIAHLESTTDVRALLDATALFGGLDDAVLTRLLPHVSLRWLGAKKTLYNQGQPGSSVFVLIEGSMKLVRRTGGAREHVVRLIRPGEVLAETVLFSSNGYPATAVALENSRLLEVDARQFAVSLRENPLLAWNVMERLGKRIEELQAQTELLATHTAEQKVAAYLVHRYRALSPSDAVVTRSCRRSDLASLLALAPETLCRVITEFKRRGWIRSESGRIVITDPKGLSGAAP
ncbi:MAG: cyclic nucleotide-binding domain-containing protein [Gammaproteobacteria bacterium]|jgi:CRP/FNR family transcriptional regulator|nr:cyclic nucleotide-binding domain-containing protein [Gammaproteobacteria bacterium]